MNGDDVHCNNEKGSLTIWKIGSLRVWNRLECQGVAAVINGSNWCCWWSMAIVGWLIAGDFLQLELDWNLGGFFRSLYIRVCRIDGQWKWYEMEDRAMVWAVAVVGGSCCGWDLLVNRFAVAKLENGRVLEELYRWSSSSYFKSQQQERMRRNREFASQQRNETVVGERD